MEIFACTHRFQGNTADQELTLIKKIDIVDISSCVFSRIENLPLVFTRFRSKGSKDLKYEIQDLPPVNLFDGKPSTNDGGFKLLSLSVL